MRRTVASQDFDPAEREMLEGLALATEEALAGRWRCLGRWGAGRAGATTRRRAGGCRPLAATRWAAGRQVRAAVRRRRAGGRRASSGDRAFGLISERPVRMYLLNSAPKQSHTAHVHV